MTLDNKDKLIGQYQLEIKLANQLRESTREQRKNLYGSLYDQFLAEYPDAFKPGQNAVREVNWIRKFVKPGTKFLEIGPGDGHFAHELSKYTQNITTIEIGSPLVRAHSGNIKRLYFDGVDLDLPADSFDLAFSNQVLEHIHSDDVGHHLRSVRESLATGGKYIIVTPHRFCGPHDISKHWSRVPTGWHMHEYTYAELIDLARKNGYTKAIAYYQRNKYSFKLGGIILAFEKVISILPRTLKKIIGRIFLPSIMVVMVK